MSWSGLPKNIEDKIMPEPNSGCWIWIGGLRSKKDGYGGVGWLGKSWRAHRLVYTLLCGPVSAALDIDHLCRTRLCCNPNHLEPCTRKENIRRGQGVASNNYRKTHCSKGHPFDSANTYWWSSQRFCRACSTIYKAAHYANRRATEQVRLGLFNPAEFYE